MRYQNKWNALIGLFAILGSPSTFAVEQSQFLEELLPVELSVGYAVRSLDLNSDGKLDIAIVDSKRVLWLEAPDWKLHIVFETPEAKFDNVCFAPLDINRDGLMDFAVGSDWQPNNTKTDGKIGWLEHGKSNRWAYHQIAEEPTTHRMQWYQPNSQDTPQLLVAPLKGKGTTGPGFDQEGVRFSAFIPFVSDSGVEWTQRMITNELPVMHNFKIFDLDGDGHDEILTASFLGVHRLTRDGDQVRTQRIGTGQETAAPAKGSSEIDVGRVSDGKHFIATIEPWHGDKVVVYSQPKEWDTKSEQLWDRKVIDDQLAWGHAVKCINLDDDPEEELIVGVRDNQSESYRCGVRIYDFVPATQEWNRVLLEPGAVAVEDLIVADLDADGDNDIVAVGRATHNAKVYWNQLINSKRD